MIHKLSNIPSSKGKGAPEGGRGFKGRKRVRQRHHKQTNKQKTKDYFGQAHHPFGDSRVC